MQQLIHLCNMNTLDERIGRAIWGLLAIAFLALLLSWPLRAVGVLPSRAQAVEHPADGGRGQGQGESEPQGPPWNEVEEEDPGQSYEQEADGNPITST
jgi:hypothetical protein